MPIVWTKPDGSVRMMQLTDSFIANNALPEETTAQTVMRLAQVEQGKNVDLADATATLVTTANVPATRVNRHQWRLNGASVVLDASVPLPYPDTGGFLDALKSAFPIQTRIAISQKYPWFIKAVEDREWADVTAYLQAALAAGVLTQPQYDNIKTIAASKSIPVTL